MTHATLLWSHWQDLLDHFAWGFSRPGYHRFAEWITAMALNAEEAGLVPASVRPTLLSQIAVARAARAARPQRTVPHQVRAGRGLVPGTGPADQGSSPGRLRWRLRPGKRRPTAGSAAGRFAPH